MNYANYDIFTEGIWKFTETETEIEIKESENEDRKEKRQKAAMKVMIKNKECMEQVIYDYTTKKGMLIVSAALSPLIMILMIFIGFIINFAPLYVAGFILLMPSILFCIELLERTERIEWKIRDYKEAAVLFDQVDVSKIDFEKGKLMFYFIKDDGTLKKLSFLGFGFEYVSYLDRDEIEVDMLKKVFNISGKYLID